MTKKAHAPMSLRNRLLASTSAVMLVAITPFGDAQAGLLGAGRTVQALFHLPNLATTELQINASTGSGAPAPIIVQQSYLQGVQSGSTSLVGDTQITITNQIPFPFCSTISPGTACPDPFTGFEFVFTGENILGVSVDPSSAPDFLPVTGNFQGNTHLGLQLISNNDIRIDVTGDVPAVGSKLVLDLSFAPITTVPEPATLALFGLGLAGIGFARRRAA